MEKRIKLCKKIISLFLAITILYSFVFTGNKVYAKDRTDPTLTLTASVATNGIVTITASAIDNSGGSGVYSITKPDSTVVTGSSTTYTVSANATYTFKATDIAGNTTSKYIIINNIPTLTLTLNTRELTDAVKSIQITATASSSSGIKNITLPNGNVITSLPATYTVSTAGNYTFVATDKEGNTTAKTTTIYDCNGDWTLKNVIKTNTREADLMVRVGDIDNFGLGWSSSFDLFSGDSNSHDFPFFPKDDDPEGTDRIMVVSGYKYDSGYTSIGTNTDQYTQETSRKDTTVYKNGNGGYAIKSGHSYNSSSYKTVFNDSTDNDNNVKTIDVDYKNYVNDASGNNILNINDATIQMYVDDFQPGKAKGITSGNVRYVAKINDVEIEELSTMINSLDCSGPKARLITFQIPERYLYLVRTGEIKIEIDDSRSDLRGDGYAVDFVKLLINKNIDGFQKTATITGTVEDSKGNAIEGATVSLSGTTGVLTNENGEYKLEKVPLGQAVVTASKTGYSSETLYQNTEANGIYNDVNFTLEEHESPITPKISITPNDHFVRDKVTTTISYSDNTTDDPKIKQYRIIDKDGNIGKWTVYNGSFEVTENCTIEAQGINVYVDDVNTEKTEYTPSDIGKLQVTNIDKTQPELALMQSADNPQIIIATATDSESGVASITNPDGTVIQGNSTTYTVSENGTYYFKATDNVGNVREASILISNIDVQSSILKHGLYNGYVTDMKDDSSLNVTNGIPITLAMIVDSKSSNPVINWSWSSSDGSSISDNQITFKKYKISSNSTTGDLETVKFDNNANIDLDRFTMDKGEYIIIYTITPVIPVGSTSTQVESGLVTVTATADGDETNSKPITLNIGAEPDLF